MNTKKTFSNVVIVLSLIATIGYLSSCSKGTSVDKLIEKAVAEGNKYCPMAIDSELRMDSVTHPEKLTLGYYYTLINLEKDSLNFTSEQIAMLESNFVQIINTDKHLEQLRKLNVTFKCVCFDKNGDLAFDIELTPEKYN